MSLNLAPQLICDFAIALVASALIPLNALRVLVSLAVPFVVSWIAFGPDWPASSAVEAGGLFYMIFGYFVALGLAVSGFATFVGYIFRLIAIKIIKDSRT
jgi:hypothetical protein